MKLLWPLLFWVEIYPRDEQLYLDHAKKIGMHLVVAYRSSLVVNRRQKVVNRRQNYKSV